MRKRLLIVIRLSKWRMTILRHTTVRELLCVHLTVLNWHWKSSSGAWNGNQGIRNFNNSIMNAKRSSQILKYKLRNRDRKSDIVLILDCKFNQIDPIDCFLLSNSPLFRQAVAYECNMQLIKRTGKKRVHIFVAA